MLLAVLGFAAVVQVRTNNQDDTYAGARMSELLTVLNQLSLASQRTKNEIAQLEQTRSELLNKNGARGTALTLAKQQAEQLGIVAGNVPAMGPGVRILVRNPTGKVRTGHLLLAIHELRDAGAEAIEINDAARVTGRTGIHDIDTGIIEVDGQQLTAPYVIDAIGAPHTLASALDILGGFIDEVEERGGTVVVEQADRIEIASVREPLVPDFAEPVEQ